MPEIARRFNDKLYHLVIRCQTEKEAKAEAREYRTLGYLARVDHLTAAEQKNKPAGSAQQHTARLRSGWYQQKHPFGVFIAKAG